MILPLLGPQHLCPLTSLWSERGDAGWKVAVDEEIAEDFQAAICSLQTDKFLPGHGTVTPVSSVLDCIAGTSPTSQTRARTSRFHAAVVRASVRIGPSAFRGASPKL